MRWVPCASQSHSGACPSVTELRMQIVANRPVYHPFSARIMGVCQAGKIPWRCIAPLCSSPNMLATGRLNGKRPNGTRLTGQQEEQGNDW